MTMQMVGVMQEVPNRDKRRARIDAADAAATVADAEQAIELLQVRQETADAWITTLAIERKLALFKQLYAENELFSRAVTARLAGGRGQLADSILPKQEAVLLADQEDLLRRNETAARAALSRWIGPAASQPLTGGWPQWQDDLAHYQYNLERHPQLLAFNPMTRQAQAEIAEAVAEKTPDWGWGVDYQRRGRDFGDMVSLSVNFDLPVFSGSRQDPIIDSERSRLAQLEAEREAVLRRYNQSLATDLAEYQRLVQSLARLEQALLPLAEEKVRLAMADYRAGSGELMAVISARQELVETRLRRVDLARDRSLTNARLHFAFGDNQP
jgi:outer membrane protein TolC